MRLRNEFTVPVPIERAWEALLDVPRVAPCLPGAVIESSKGDEHIGAMTIKLGPITSRFTGTVRIEDADEQARTTVIRAQGQDARKQGTATAVITSQMEAVDDGTRIVVETDMLVTGPVAQFGRGIMQDVSARLMKDFADRLEREIAGEQPAARVGPSGDAFSPRTDDQTHPPPAVDALDLGAASRAALVKRAIPALAVLIVLAALAWLLARR